MWRELAVALGLMLIIEGVLPFLNPAALRRALAAISELNDAQLRAAGLTSMITGVVLLFMLGR